MAPFKGIYLTSYLMAIVMFALSLVIGKIIAKQEECQNFDLQNEDHGQLIEERNLCHSIENVRIHIGDFFQNFNFLATYV